MMSSIVTAMPQLSGTRHRKPMIDAGSTNGLGPPVNGTCSTPSRAINVVGGSHDVGHAPRGSWVREMLCLEMTLN